MNKNIDIYQDKAIREKEKNKNEAINNLNNDKGTNEKENKELEHFDELIKGEQRSNQTVKKTQTCRP